MKTQVIAGLAIVMFASFSWAQKWVQPTQDGVGIYKNEVRQVYEQPVTTVGSSVRLEVLQAKKESYKVRFDNQEGWVEKRLVAAVAKGAKSYTFDDAEVIGYLDNPTPVYILDANDQERDPIQLHRSFADALRENVDKETIERQATK
jgi:hypothetical protein